MEIKTGLDHEKNGGKTMVMFAKPWIKNMKPNDIIYCPIEVIAYSKKSKDSVGFDSCRIITSEITFKKSQLKAIRSFCKHLANDYIVFNWKGEKLKKATDRKNSKEIIRTKLWTGFHFNLT